MNSNVNRLFVSFYHIYVLVDSLGKECLDDDKLLYLYRDKVKIPPLAMVDDVLVVSECGYKSVKNSSEETPVWYG